MENTEKKFEMLLEQQILEDSGIGSPEENAIWSIDTDAKADWAIAKIKDYNNEIERFNSVSNERIKQIQLASKKEIDKIEGEKLFFQHKLMEYMNTVKVKTTKTQDTYSLPSGKLVRKKDKNDFKVDKEVILKSIEEDGLYEDFIKEKKELNWADLKKRLVIKDGNIIDKETGEVLEINGLTTEVKEGKFEIK